MRKRLLYLLIIFLLFLIIILFKLFISNTNTEVFQLDSSSHSHLNIYTDIDYLGINQCKDCHFDIYETYIQTGMGKSFNYATKENSSSVFDTVYYVAACVDAAGVDASSIYSD